MNVADAKEQPSAKGIYHPLLFALVPLLGLYAQNAGKVPWSSVLRAGLLLLVAACAVWAVCAAVAGNRRKGAMAASVLIFAALPGWTLLEYSIEALSPLSDGWPPIAWEGAYAVMVVAAFGVLARTEGGRSRKTLAKFAAVIAAGGGVAFLLGRTFLVSAFGQTAGWLIAMYLVGVATVLAVVLRRASDFARSTRTANWFAGILVLLFVANCFYQYPRATNRTPPAFDARPSASEPERGWPDFYVVFLDGYARADVLRQLYGYNNGPFLASLREMGFQVPENAFANYPNTMTSLASCLNMDYLENLVPREDIGIANVGDVADLCHNNRFYEFLRGQGYTLMAFSPGTAMREPRSTVDVCLGPALALSEFEMVLLSSIAPGRVVQACYHYRHGRAAYWSYAFLRRRVAYLFDELARVAVEESAKPRLVFAQLTIPGPPFLFDRDGNWSVPGQATQRVFGETFRGTSLEFRDRYRSQLHYTNLLVERCLKQIVDGATRPAVVVLASDHGPLLRTNGEQLDGATRQERYGTLMAVRLPEGVKAELWRPGDAVSLVNLFRVTLNSVFGANLEVLPNRTFYSSAEKPFETIPFPLSP